jgi:hypothetical protein
MMERNPKTLRVGIHGDVDAADQPTVRDQIEGSQPAEFGVRLGGSVGFSAGGQPEQIEFLD